MPASSLIDYYVESDVWFFGALSIAISDDNRDISEKATLRRSRSASKLSALVFICEKRAVG